MANEELFQNLISDKETMLSARIDMQYDNIRNIQMSHMSLEKQVVKVANYLNFNPQGGLRDDT